jgi:hypothetical protein
MVRAVQYLVTAEAVPAVTPDRRARAVRSASAAQPEAKAGPMEPAADDAAAEAPPAAARRRTRTVTSETKP